MDAPLLLTLGVTSLAFTGIWLINVLTEDAGVIDYYWGPGFAVIALIHVAFNGLAGPMHAVLLAAIVFWSARLAIHLVWRHHASTREDGRYRAMRDSGGPSFWWSSLFKVFLLQALLLWIIAAPVHIAFGGAQVTAWPAAFWLGIAVFAAGLAIEWIADVQLARGRLAAPDGGLGESSLVTSGLWRISRHPNYVGEIILWWGIALSAFALSGSAWAFAGPALLSVVIIGVSLPLTEQHMLRTRPGYADYMAAVPALVGFARNPGKAARQPAE